MAEYHSTRTSQPLPRTKREKEVLNGIWVAKTKHLPHGVILLSPLFLEKHMGPSECF